MGRVNYKVILDRYKAVGKANVRLTQSSLYLTQPITPTKTSYSFEVLETQTQNQQPDEIRLNINDEFILTQLGLYLEAEMTGGPADTAGQKYLFTYVPAELNGVAGQKLMNVYNGQLQISVNNIVYVDKWDTKKHLFIPRTQFENFVNVVGVNQAKQPSMDFSTNGIYPVEPLLTLSGAKKNVILLNLPQAVTAGIFNWTDDLGVVQSFTISRIALLMRGLNAQNGSSFQK